MGFDVEFRIKFEAELRKHHVERSLLEEPSNLSHNNRKNSSAATSTSLNLSLGSDKNENEPKRPEKIDTPMILICVNGGYDALRLIDEALKQKIPVLVLLVSCFFFNFHLLNIQTG
jgi:hypothetical protein